MTAVKVAVIVVNWNTAELLEACLAAFDAQDHDDLEIIVVDNASTDGSGALLEAVASNDHRHTVRVIRQETNRGFSGAINDALAVVDAPVVVFSNVDVVPEPELISRALEALLAGDRRGTVAPKLLRTVHAPEGGDVLDSAGHVLTTARLVHNRGEGELDEGRYDVAGPVFGASGALVVHRREMLDDVAWRSSERGGFRAASAAATARRWSGGEVLTEDLFAFFEDVELDWRARLLGWDAWYEPRAVARHQRGGTGPRRSPRVEALNWANRLLVIATCDDRGSFIRASPLVLLTTVLKTLELVVSTPRAVPHAFGRLRLLRRARLRRRELLERARRDPAAVVRAWVEPFRFGAWVGTWWRRVTGRAPGVAR